MQPEDCPRAIDLDVTRRQDAIAVVEDGGDNINYDHADWAEAS